METINSYNYTMYQQPPPHQQQQQQTNKRKQPGAKAKKGEASPGTPIFLRKSYDMINTCDPTIASWYDDGTTFVVKDTERFASEVIPEYFKHSNFSSFVRQLNFYGFRKIKSDPLRIKESSEESKFWKFRHDKFQRGRPDLLSQIRKNQNETADKQDVDNLRKENQDLRAKLDLVSNDVAHLKSLVNTLMKNQEVQTNQAFFQAGVAAAKKPRLEPSNSAVATTFHTPAPTTAAASLTPLPLPGNETIVSQQVTTTTTQPITDGSVTSGFDDDVLASLMSIDPSDDLKLLEALDMPEDNFCKMGTSNAVDQQLINKVRDALARLPVQMQSIYVDRMVAAVTNPVALQKQTDSMTTLIGSAAEEAQRRLIAAGRQPNEKHMPCIATVILNAFLARSSEQQQQQEELAAAAAAAAASADDITSFPAPQPF